MALARSVSSSRNHLPIETDAKNSNGVEKKSSRESRSQQMNAHAQTTNVHPK
jgi:hypothetical protein